MYFYHYLGTIGRVPKDTEWETNFTRGALDNFLMSHDFHPYRGKTLNSVHTVKNMSVIPPSSGTPIKGNIGTAIKDPIAEFNKGVKRDQSIFPKLKDSKSWDTYYRGTKATARAQNLSNVLDLKYKPSNKEEKALFDLQQAFMFAVAEATLLTDAGKALVCEHETDYDAQKIYASLVEKYSTSTSAVQEASTSEM